MQEGEILAFESGEYSDFGVVAFVRALTSDNLDILLTNYRAQSGRLHKTSEYEQVEPTEFVQWLIDNKHVVLVKDIRCVHLGSYGKMPDDNLESLVNWVQPFMVQEDR